MKESNVNINNVQGLNYINKKINIRMQLHFLVEFTFFLVELNEIK
jgi:hypothetical protein